MHGVLPPVRNRQTPRCTARRLLNTARHRHAQIIRHRSQSTQPVFRRQASPSNSGPELNSPSRDMGFFRAGTEPARSALQFPDPRLFAIASSFHLNSFCCTPWFDIATGLPRFVRGLAVVRWMERQLYAELPRRGMQLPTAHLEKRPSFHGYLSRIRVIHAAAPATACQNTDARCHALSR